MSVGKQLCEMIGVLCQSVLFSVACHRWNVCSLLQDFLIRSNAEEIGSHVMIMSTYGLCSLERRTHANLVSAVQPVTQCTTRHNLDHAEM